MSWKLLFCLILVFLLNCGSSKPDPTVDFDLDGIPDINDIFPNDTDNDGLINPDDPDDDNDGVMDELDRFPFDPAESVDTDSDGIGNNQDTDDDGDGILDAHDVFPLNKDESADTDMDGMGDNADPDADNDGFSDETDLFPADVTKAGDHDGDGVDSLSDLDDDNDGYLDNLEEEEGSDPLNAGSTPLDADQDGLTDREEEDFGSNPNVADTDGDGLGDKVEFALKTDPNSSDTDGDGRNDSFEVGSDLNNVPDIDKDGIIDAKDYYGVFEFRTLEASPQPSNDRFGLDVGSGGLIYIVDPFAHEIRSYDQTGALFQTLGREGNGAGEFFYPNDVVLQSSGSFFVADTNNNRIQEFNNILQYLTTHSRQPDGNPGGFLFPRGMDVDLRSSDLYVADTVNHRIQRFKGGQWEILSITGLQNPSDIAIGPSGEIAVSDFANFRVVVFDTNIGLLFTVNNVSLSLTPFDFQPVSLDFDSNGNLFILDAASSRVVVVDSTGSIIRVFGTSGRGEGEFFYPSGLHVDSTGKVYVSDRTRIQIF